MAASHATSTGLASVMNPQEVLTIWAIVPLDGSEKRSVGEEAAAPNTLGLILQDSLYVAIRKSSIGSVKSGLCTSV